MMQQVFVPSLLARGQSLFSQARIVRGPPTFRQRKRCRQRERGRDGGRKHNTSYFSDLLPWHVALSSDLRRMSEPSIIYNTHTLPPAPAPDRASFHFTALHSLLPFWTPFHSCPGSTRFRFRSLIRSCRTIKCIAPVPFWRVRQVATWWMPQQEPINSNYVCVSEEAE